jgi:hypothetical protein
MIAGRQRRQLAWPATGRFPPHGAVWPRKRLDAHLIDAADGRRGRARLRDRGAPDPRRRRRGVTGVEAGHRACTPTSPWSPPVRPAPSAACSAPSGWSDEPFGLAIRTYVESPRHADRHLEACLTLRDRARHAGARLRLDVPLRRRHREHRRRRAVDDEGFKRSTSTAARRLPGLVRDEWESATVPRDGPGPGGCR